MASVKVAVRVRPFNQRELNLGSTCIIRMQGNKTAILNANPKPDILDSSQSSINSSHRKEFIYDYSYWSVDPEDPDFATQEKVYSDLGSEVVEDAFEGYNACVFAYGQTGSGKTYSMMGAPGNEGLIPRICKELFSRMDEARATGSSFRTEVSYLEIYNERVKDLLGKNCDDKSLKVREHPKLGPYVQGLSKHLVTDYSDVQELMTRGNAHRTTAATGMNDSSSRSHAIFTIAFSQASFSKDTPRETLSKVNLVDLAGSERANATGATGQRLKEGGHINKSLVTLGSVISALADTSQNNNTIGGSGKKHHFIPYRDSVLTWLLKDSLGGNSKTVMIATISPADCNYNETLSTLRYANRAKNIINKPTINEDTNTKLIRDLRAEIERLKSLITEHPTMIEKVHENEAKVKLLTEEWTEKWKETQKILKEQRTLGLRKAGLGIVLDSDLPHLVGIDDDLLSTGITLYHLKEGQTRIGTEFAETKQDITLHGHDVEDEHCLIELRNGVATLVPLNDSICFVNTEKVDRPTKLSQGYVILLGRNNMFRFNDPVEVHRLRNENMSGSCLNLSRVFSRSSDLTKSVDNLWSPAAVDCSSADLEEKRKEIMELEEEHRRAEQRRKEEAIKADEELQQKKRELEEVIHKRAELQNIIEDSLRRLKARKKRMLSSDTDTNLSNIGNNLNLLKEGADSAKHIISEHLEGMSDSGDSGEPTSITSVLQSLYDKLNEDMQLLKEEEELRKASSDNTQDGITLLLSDSPAFQNTHILNSLMKFSEEPLGGNHSNQSPLSELSEQLVQTDILKTSDATVTVEEMDVSRNLDDSPEIGNDEEFNSKMEELKEKEKQLLQMEDKLKEQQSLFEIQRNKELAQIEREKHKLKEMEKEAKLDEIIEREVKKRLQEHQSRFEASWRQELESRVNSYLRITSSPSPPSTPTTFENEPPRLDKVVSKLSVACQQHADDLSIQIKSYALRNIRFDKYFEYEVSISLNGESWTLFRRYRRFRDLHISMMKQYGTKVVLPYFPPRTLFGKTSVELAERRKQLLEKYLQDLIARCQRCLDCPISFEALGPQPLRKEHLFQFSPFFKDILDDARSVSG